MNNKGFSLVELLAAIAIMAIISAVITPVVTGVIKQNKKDACNSLIKSIESAANSYVSDNRYNSTVASGNTFTITLQTLKDGGYLKGIIKDPLDDDDTEGKHLTETVTVTYNTISKTFSYTYNGSITCNS